jgi:putative phage-type endonuclease
VAERLTGIPQDSFQNAAMQRGTETEPEARAAYEFYQDVEVELCGFVDHPTIAMAGASPDGRVVVGPIGLVEIKCPHTSTHIETLLGGTIPDKYVVQMLWQMACTGANWCSFVSYDNRMPENLRLFVRRIERDDKRIAELEAEARAFLAEVDAKVAALSALGRREAA